MRWRVCWGRRRRARCVADRAECGGGFVLERQVSHTWLGGRPPRLEEVGRLEQQVAQFDALTALARGVADAEPGALVQLARLVGRKLQADAIHLRLLDTADWGSWESSPPACWFDRSLALTPDGRAFDDLVPQRPTDRIVSLATAVVLTGPWSRACLARVLARIGAGRPWGAWRGDPLNHAAIIWLPWGLVEMINGLHSAIAGAALSKGVFRATVVCDVGPLYEHVACDGRYYTRRHDGAVLAQVEDVQWATLFEIGRLMLERRVSA